MDIRDRKQALYNAMDQLDSAINNIRVALRGTTFESHADAYIIGHLRHWVDGEGTYNMGIQQYINKLDDEENYDEDEDQ